MANSPRHSVSVAGVVVNDRGEILVIKRRDNGEWQPPGGVLELKESIEQGTRREILEETGIEVTVGPVTGVYKNMRLNVVALVLYCTRPDGHAKPGVEASEVEWLDPDEAIQRMSEVFSTRVRDALTEVRGAIQRTHDGQHFW